MLTSHWISGDFVWTTDRQTDKPIALPLAVHVRGVISLQIELIGLFNLHDTSMHACGFFECVVWIRGTHPSTGLVSECTLA